MLQIELPCLGKSKMISINQTHAQIKLTEMWKAINVTNYPHKTCTLSLRENGRIKRGATNSNILEP